MKQPTGDTVFNQDRGRRHYRRSMFGEMHPDMRPGWFEMWGGGRGRAARRGDVRDAILAILAKEPMHGYRIIQELDEQSGGWWRPSAGSVYPTLQQLEDEGLVTCSEEEGKRVFSLTEAGREAAAAVATRGRPHWQEHPGRRSYGAGGGPADASAAEFREALYHLGAAVMQAAQVGSPQTVALVRNALVEARKSIYQALAEQAEPGEPAEPTEAGKPDKPEKPDAK
jgi:DNA-binding PadR family transcriptional regulator